MATLSLSEILLITLVPIIWIGTLIHIIKEYKHSNYQLIAQIILICVFNILFVAYYWLEFLIIKLVQLKKA